VAVTVFRRRLPPRALAYLQTMPRWWKDVLEYRFSAGGSKRPLLVAVRNRYLNIYAEGQSVLKVEFDTRRADAFRLRCKIHRKYVCGEDAGEGYLVFDGERITTSDGLQLVATYRGEETLGSWIKAARGYASDEKKGVAIIAENHPEVIDVEMALPANIPIEPDGSVAANRMDIVALERIHDFARIVFYEAKLFSNQELRNNDLKPRVLHQLRSYRDYVSAPGRRDEVIAAYRDACALLVEVGKMRGIAAAPLVQEVAAGLDLTLDPNPRLLVFGYQPEQVGTGSAWQRHEDALRQEGISLHLSAHPNDVKLRASV
jgi:hypothetical protein